MLLTEPTFTVRLASPAILAASHGLLGDVDEAEWAATELRRLAPEFDPRNPGTLLSHVAPNFAPHLIGGLEQAGFEA